VAKIHRDFDLVPSCTIVVLLRALLGKVAFRKYGSVHDLVELREVAVKIHQLDPRWSDAKKENYTKHVSREYEIHHNVRHPRIVSDVFGLTTTRSPLSSSCAKEHRSRRGQKKKRLADAMAERSPANSVGYAVLEPPFV
jgi:hypothetical protein